MRVDKSRTSTSVAGRKSTRSADGFSIPDTGADAATSTVPVAGASGVGSVDAILALQAEAPVEERRQRAARRGRRIMDALDRLRIGLLEGHVEPAHLSLLQATLKDQREDTEDSELESILDQIELRARVELEKGLLAQTSQKR